MLSTDLLLVTILTWSFSESSLVCKSNMRPDGYVGPSTCSLTHEDMTFTCAVSFSGEPPQMIWKILNDSQSFNVSTCKIENGQMNCSLTIRADPMYDGSTFNCLSTKPIAECSTGVIKVNYFESLETESSIVTKNISDKVNCSVKSNQKLEFKWTVLQDNQYASVTDSQLLLIRGPGLYRCEVKYNIRNAECFMHGSDVYVPRRDCEQDVTAVTTVTAVTARTLGTSEIAAIVLAIVLGLFVVIAIVAIIGWLRCLQKKREICKQKNETKRMNEGQVDGGGGNCCRLFI